MKLEDVKDGQAYVFGQVLIKNVGKTVDGGFTITIEMGQDEKETWADLVADLRPFTAVFVPINKD